MEVLVTLLCPTLKTPGTVAQQAPLFMELSRQEYWNGLLFPSPGDLPNPEINPVSSALACGFFTTVTPGKPDHMFTHHLHNIYTFFFLKWQK